MASDHLAAAILLHVFGPGRAERVADTGRQRPAELPAVRGSPLPITLSLQRVAVLRI